MTKMMPINASAAQTEQQIKYGKRNGAGQKVLQ